MMIVPKKSPHVTNHSQAAPIPESQPLTVTKSRWKMKKAITHALELQEILMNRMRNPALKASVLAQCVRAWDCLEERKRILRGVPLPGQLQPSLSPELMAKRLKMGERFRKKSGPSFIELPEQSPSSSASAIPEKESLSQEGG